MEPSEIYPGESSSSQSRIGGLKGPRPTQLRVSKDSHKIKKPPVAPAAPPQPQPQQNRPSLTAAENRQPLVIYSVSPKVIHTTVGGFMDLVQRLTGSSSSSSSSSAAAVDSSLPDPTAVAATGTTSRGDISPAARLASIERASPSGREKERETVVAEVLGMAEGIEVGQIPGILSPAPASLPPIIPSGLFSPTYDPQNFSSLQHDLNSPFMHGYNFFIPSPSTLFAAAPIASPSPSSFDHYNPFFDF